MSDLQYPPTFDELNLAGDVHIRPEDIAKYYMPPGRCERYTEEGWRKAQAIGIAMPSPNTGEATP